MKVKLLTEVLIDSDFRQQNQVVDIDEKKAHELVENKQAEYVDLPVSEKSPESIEVKSGFKISDKI